MTGIATVLVTLAIAFVLGVPSVVSGQEPHRSLGSVLPAVRQATSPEKAALANQILQAREDALQREAFGRNFRRHWLDQLTGLSVAQLVSIADAGPSVNLDEAVAGFSSHNATQDLGNTSADLVYTKVAPCRIVDTRVAGGPLGTASSRDFYVAGTDPSRFSPQGGGPCEIPLGATSVAINITVVTGAGSGWLRAYPYGGSGNASVINYSAGQTIANGLILPICDPAAGPLCWKDLTVVADSYGAHVLLDVLGYFQYVNKDDYRAQAQGVGGEVPTQVTIPATSCTSVTQLNFQSSVNGSVVLDGYLKLAITHSTGSDSVVEYAIGTTPSDCRGLSMAMSETVEPQMPSGTYVRHVQTRVIGWANAGQTVTFYLNARRTGTTPDAAWKAYYLTGVFYPQ